MSKTPIGVQLYSVRNELRDDLLGTVKAIADMGYEGVEFAGPLPDSPEKLKALLDELGLKCCGWHTSYESVQGENLTGVVEASRVLENSYVVVPALGPDLRKGKDDWIKLSEVFSDISAKLESEGMHFGYHNHMFEFEVTEGELPFDILFARASKDVFAQVDTGNASAAGVDIIPLLDKYSNRLRTIHLKPYSKSVVKNDVHEGFVPLVGEDETPWNEVFSICEGSGVTEWYIVEYECSDIPALKAVDRILQNLHGMGK